MANLISGEFYYNYFFEASGDAQDMARIDQTISIASDYCERYCRRPFLPGSDVSVPTDAAGVELSAYAYYDTIDDVPLEIKFACCLIVRWHVLVSEHMGATSTSFAGAAQGYKLDRPVEAWTILDRYRYHPALPQPGDHLLSDNRPGYFDGMI